MYVYIYIHTYISLWFCLYACKHVHVIGMRGESTACRSWLSSSTMGLGMELNPSGLVGKHLHFTHWTISRAQELKYLFLLPSPHHSLCSWGRLWPSCPSAPPSSLKGLQALPQDPGDFCSLSAADWTMPLCMLGKHSTNRSKPLSRNKQTNKP